MSIGAHSVFDIVLSSANTFSGFTDLGQAWGSVFLKVPTMTSGSDMFLRAAAASGAATGAGFRLMHPVVNTSSVQVQTFVIASATTNRLVPIPNGLRYLAIECTTAPTSTITFQVFCGN